MENLFHLSLPCKNLVETKMFYVDTIGASLGRFENNWFDINLFGHQVTFTKAGKFEIVYTSAIEIVLDDDGFEEEVEILTIIGLKQIKK